MRDRSSEVRLDLIRIELDRPDRSYRTGEVLEGHLVVAVPEGRACSSIRLFRFWRTIGRGNQDFGGRLAIRVHEGPLPGAPPQRIPFSLPVPDGPLSYVGALFEVDHYIEAHLELDVGVGGVATEQFELQPGTAPVPPNPELITVTGSRARRSAGCRIGLGALFVLFGFLTLPMGIVLMALGVFLLFPVVRRGVAGAKLGEVTSRLGDPLVQPGGLAHVEVRMDPLKRRRINGVTAVIRGREISVTKHDRDMKVHEHEIHGRTVTLSGSRALAAGEATILTAEIPLPDTHAWTFSSEHNEVTWDLTVHVDIPGWPDWYEEHKLLVWPWAPPGRVRAQEREELSADTGPEATLPPGPSEAGAESSDERRRSERELATLLEAVRRSEAVGPPSGESTAVRPVEGPPTPEMLTAVEALEPSGTASQTAGPPAGAIPEEPTAEKPTPEGPRAEGPILEASRPDASIPGLATRVEAVLEAKALGGARDRLVRALTGERFTFALEIGQIQRTFAAGPDPDYRAGRTVTGVIFGTAVRVAVRFPASRNDEIDALPSGSALEVAGTVIDWEKLARLPVLEA